jgi:hypothetical protein
MHFEHVWGANALDVWAVGDGNVIAHFTGSGWTTVQNPVNANLHGLWGSSPSDIFAVGDGGRIVHYDGSQWVPMQSGTTETFWSVWGSGPKNVYAVGSNETIVHYDGTVWRTERTAPTGSTFYTVWGSGPEDVYAIGCGNPAISVRFDGLRWRTPPSVCAWAMTGFPQGGAVAVLWSRWAYFGLSPTGQLGASTASAFRAFSGPSSAGPTSGRYDPLPPNGARR